ncbi:hypothetical protein [Thermococcus sp.]
MPFIPQGNVTDKGLLAVILGMVLFYGVMRIYARFMDAYIQKKERELQEKLKEEEEIGDVY